MSKQLIDHIGVLCTEEYLLNKIESGMKIIDIGISCNCICFFEKNSSKEYIIPFKNKKLQKILGTEDCLINHVALRISKEKMIEFPKYTTGVKRGMLITFVKPWLELVAYDKN